MKPYPTIVIGAGAAGITAAISAKRRGDPVIVCDRMPQSGKKILASGNGRCNLLNDDLSESNYNMSARVLARSIFSKFGKADIFDFFKKLGLEMYSDNGRIFPVTNQSSSVLKVLELELKRLSIPVEFNFDVIDISGSKDSFILKSKSGRTMQSSKVVIATGGRSYPALGSDGSMLKLVERFGHNIIDTVPSAVPILTKNKLCHLLQGQKIFARASSVIDQKTASEASGDILFTKYGLSGTAILDISRELSVALNRSNKKDVAVLVDMVPFMDANALKTGLARRMESGISGEDILTGILPNKFGRVLKDAIYGMNAAEIADMLKSMLFKVTGTRGWNEAEFTSGGIDTLEVVTDTLESKIKKGVYFAGEILDVDGRRGGYNLAWAWASGYVAGLAGQSQE